MMRSPEAGHPGGRRIQLLVIDPWRWIPANPLVKMTFLAGVSAIDRSGRPR
jgi:hypothetical protein